MKKFNDEFKGNAVKLVREEVANDLGIGVSTLKVWLSKHDHGRLIKTEKQAREEEEVKRLKKGHGHFLLDVKSKYRAMKKLRKEFPIEKMSQVFGVTRSGYYRFLSSPKGKRVQEEEKLTEEVE